ncbi:cyclic GMP-AMP synthase-like receptor [Arctopsyche grandis]|uniref:cyclic GMP-AMP synthase-like receptor n=1 Tax=Arctopsyche grandis TaxID=121162 RepID=UPI00406D9F70
MDERLSRYKIFDPVIQRLNSLFINPSDEIVNECKRSFIDFFYHFQQNLCKQDPVINSYREIQYYGSFSDHLQIGNMYKEFNGAILIRLPKESFEIETSSPGHVNITLDMPKNIPKNIHQTFKNWLDHENYIMPNKFRIWGESIITKSMNNLEQFGSERLIKGRDGDYLFSMSKSDPSFTLHVEKLNTNIKIDVDILLCLEFVDSFRSLDKDVCNKEWLAEPKEPTNYPNQRGWRYTFPKAEKQAIANCEHMKSTIRLIKKLCDIHKMPYLTSYHIKTIFLWETDNRSANYWQQSLSCLMVSAIAKIQNAIDTQDVSFYWDHRLNLLNTLKLTQIQDCQRKLNTIMKNIQLYCVQQRPESIIEILLTSEEKNAYRNSVDSDRHQLDRWQNPGASSHGDNEGHLETIAPETIALGIGAAAAAVMGGFMLYRAFRGRDD